MQSAATGGDFASWIADPVFGIDPGDQGFGINPGIGNTGLTSTGKSGSVFSFQHPEADPPLSDLNGSYEWSLDLLTWNAPGTVGDTTVAITATPDTAGGGTTTTVEADTTGSTVPPAKLFVRAVATQN